VIGEQLTDVRKEAVMALVASVNDIGRKEE
jgi:hypothetical protein